MRNEVNYLTHIEFTMDENNSDQMVIETQGSLYFLILGISEALAKMIEDHAEDYDEATTILAETLHVLHQDAQEILAESFAS